VSTLADFQSFLCFFLFFSVFRRVVYYRGVVCLFQGLRFLALGSARLRLPVGCVVSVFVGVGCRVPVAPSGPVCPFLDLGQVFDCPIRTSVPNKCSKEKKGVFGPLL
jgi:hypothetical protein